MRGADVTELSRDSEISDSSHAFIGCRVPGDFGTRLAVKDNIDVAGMVTTNGMRLSGSGHQRVAMRDAYCVVRLRNAGFSIVGKTNLHELALGASGINPWYGTPTNPIDRTRVPGGSSSGSAVAVANGDADLALGTDTGGSVRIPAACCGVFGLKPTTGIVPTNGVTPLSKTLDTVGLLARTAEMLELGWAALCPFHESRTPAPVVIGRLVTSAACNVEDAVDTALGNAGFRYTTVSLPIWEDAYEATLNLQLHEAFLAHKNLLDNDVIVGNDVRHSLEAGANVTQLQLRSAEAVKVEFVAQVSRLMKQLNVIVTPTLAIEIPHPQDADRKCLTQYTRPVNMLGLPAVSVPINTGGLPGSMQLIGATNSEAVLLSLAGTIYRSAST